MEIAKEECIPSSVCLFSQVGTSHRTMVLPRQPFQIYANINPIPKPTTRQHNTTHITIQTHTPHITTTHHNTRITAMPYHTNRITSQYHTPHPTPNELIVQASLLLIHTRESEQILWHLGVSSETTHLVYIVQSIQLATEITHTQIEGKQIVKGWHEGPHTQRERVNRQSRGDMKDHTYRERDNRQSRGGIRTTHTQRETIDSQGVA